MSSSDLESSTSPQKKPTLFEYSEDELLHEHVLTHYEILDVAVHAGTADVKKAYRKASLKYHPDKTGRGDNDYVFLAVKAAHDVLMDPEKRQAYDSTQMEFDDAIPPATVAATISSAEDDPDLFFKIFEPVFLRNLRFDARLRPEHTKKKPGTSGKSNKQANGSSNGSQKPNPPPSLGTADTPLDQVHAFYEYWVHFESWRDFSGTAADELQVENELENAESRFEKRWIQKEIDKRARQLKKQEMARIQTLVERAMECDPRLQQERKEQLARKQDAMRQRELAAERKKEQAAAAEMAKEQQLVEELERKAQEKVEREKEKKVLRKARQELRKMASASFGELQETSDSLLSSPSSLLWKDPYDFNQDVEFLCTSLDLNELRALNETYKQAQQADEALKMIQHKVVLIKQEQEEEEKAAAATTATTKAATISTTKIPLWSKEELSALAKAVKKYPPGGSGRWEQIALFVNNLCRLDHRRSKEECIEKYNNVARNGKSGTDYNAKESSENTEAAPSASTMAEDTGGNADADSWTPQQDQLLQDALSEYPATLEKNERWTKIAKAVTGKTKKQCVQRFKAIREALMAKK